MDPSPRPRAATTASLGPVLVMTVSVMTVLAVLTVVACGGDEPARELTATERARFDAAWTALHEHLATAHPGVGLDLRPGAAEEDLAAYERAVGRRLPPGVRALYRRADGQGTDGYALFPGYRFLPLEEAVGEWTLMRDLRLRPLGLLPADGDPGVRGRWYHPGWLPIAANGGGDMLCADRVPAPGGRDGQIVEFYHDDTPRRLVAKSVTDFLEGLRRDLENGDLVPYAEWKNFVRPSDLPRRR